MKCKLCKTGQMEDLTRGQGEERNFYCPKCKGHFWKGRWYTRKVWDAWLEADEIDPEDLEAAAECFDRLVQKHKRR